MSDDFGPGLVDRSRTLTGPNSKEAPAGPEQAPSTRPIWFADPEPPWECVTLSNPDGQTNVSLFNPNFHQPCRPHIPANPGPPASPSLSEESPKHPFSFCSLMKPSAISPRPILKRSSSSPHENNSELPFYGVQTVHFPPSPSLSRFYSAHPSSIYDRSPLVVSPNACALPERGCPGRTYDADERFSFTSVNISTTPRGGHRHPRAFSGSAPQQNLPPCPPLVLDLSSESEESDGLISPPPEKIIPSFTRRSDKYPSQLSLDSTAYLSNKLDCVQTHSSLDSRWRARRIRSPTFGEIPADDPGYEDDRDIPSPSSQLPSRKSRCSRKSLSSQGQTSFGGSDDGGCLGGF
ncbi:hypothetical protein D9757_007559 [Collybiopsis confluens]|uniref:Uncharacterized protein n=1 Tax=Collybiopsis confluens TaxID=2823264 RepID=A0A8H5HEU3_9AGAR|nr:hypothetical protein D9757_007559 [Collybiopsis confluens]